MKEGFDDARKQLERLDTDLAELLNGSPAGTDQLRRIASDFAATVERLAEPVLEALRRAAPAGDDLGEQVKLAMATVLAIAKLTNISADTPLSSGEEVLIRRMFGQTFGRKGAEALTTEQRSKAGKARAGSMSPKERAELASKGGKASAANLTPEERSERARRAVAAREAKKKRHGAE